MSTPLSILITGSSSGFGRLTALSLARRGHTVFATMRESEGRNAGAAAELRDIASAESLSLRVIELDVSDTTSVENGVRDAVSITGRIDVAINNAGRFVGGLTEGFTDSQLGNLFDLHVVGPHRVARAVLPFMREQGDGLLVWISSGMARFILPYAGPYTASKMALEGLAESYRYDLAPLGIDSVIVEPGAHPTGGMAKTEYPADYGRFSGYGPVADLPGQFFAGFAQMMQGPGAPDPQDVADAIVALIETPRGSRPLRTVVDNLLGQNAEAVNATTGEVQRQLLGAMQMASLLGPKGA